MINRYYELNSNTSATAREFRTKRQTVREWVNRYERLGLEDLKNSSRALCTRPLKTHYEAKE
jgi:transposase